MNSRTIKFALAIGLLALTTTKSYAAGEASFSKGHSTWTVEGVTCTTGTAVEITKELTGFNISGYRLINQDSADSIWLGPDSSVSTDTTKAQLGEVLAAGASGVWELGRNPDRAQLAVKLWCKAADAAGASAVRLSRAVFGYK